MSRPKETADPAAAPVHLTIRSATAGPPEVRFQFQQQEQRMSGAVGVSVVAHLVFIVVAVMIIRFAPEPERQAFLPQRSPDGIVWIAQPGPGGGGGGGGDVTPEPPAELEIPGEEVIAVPVAEPAEPEIAEPDVLDQAVSISALAMNAGDIMRPGLLESNQASASVSRGAGLGTGIGEGEGDGIGEGEGGGFGGGAFQPGNGVELPRVVREVGPRYTPGAMRAQLQGSVLLECVVLSDGSVGDIRIVRSLDSTFGLDDEAVRAARQWEFEPGTRFGEPVAVLVTIELSFTLR